MDRGSDSHPAADRCEDWGDLGQPVDGSSAGSHGNGQPSWLLDRDRLQALAQSVEPAARLVTKDAWLWKLLGLLAAGATLGGISAERFLRDFATTIGPLQGYPAHWSADRVEALLVHEARHTRQARWCGLGLHPWIGLPIFALLYLVPLFPFGLALTRLWFELDADRAAWRHALACGVPEDVVRTRAQQFASVVCSGSYGWPVPSPVGRAWFERAVERTIRDTLGDASERRRPA